MLVQLPLQGAAMHVQGTCGSRDVAVEVREYALNVFPFQAVEGKRTFVDRRLDRRGAVLEGGEDLVG